MAVVADRVIVELEARLGQYNASLKRAEQNFSRSVASQQADIKRLEEQIAQSSDGISGSLKGLAATFAAAFSVAKVQELADGYTRFTNALTVAGLEGERLATTQGQLFDIAQRGGVQLELLGRLYGGLSTLQKDLNTTSADSLALTQAVSNSVRIQGTSAEAAAGGILGLNQALGSATVQTDEFNQIVDGLRPLLQAAVDGSDKYAGSINRLKVAIGEGEVSGRDLFELLQGGFDELAKKAELSTLTIENSFVVLNNALGVYIGQTDDALSATERVSGAIIALSENLDTVASALAVIAAILVGRYVAATVAATAATGVMGTAIFAIQARALGAATTMEALALASTTAGRAMLAAFGGPVGLAIAAIGIAIFAVANSARGAEAATGEYKTALDQSKVASDAASDAAQRLASAHGETRAEALRAARQEQELTKQKLASARASLVQAQAELQRARAFQAAQNAASVGSTGVPGTALFIQGTGDTRVATARSNVDAASATIANLEKSVKVIDEAIAAATAPEVRVAPTSPGTGPRGNPGADRARAADEAERQARRAVETQARVDNEIAQLAVDRLQAIADLTQSANDRAVADMAQLQADRAAFDRAIKLDEDLTDAQRQQLTAARISADVEKALAIVARKRQQLADEQLARESDVRNGEAELIRARGEARDRTAGQRRETELRLIALQFDEERAQLEAIVASETSTQLEREIAEAKLARLGELQALAEETARLRNQTPFERYMDEITRTEAELNEEFERIQVRGLDTLNDGLADAIMGAKSLGDVFKEVANQIIADLIRIAIQQAIIAPLLEALGGGSGGGGFGGGSGGGGFGGFFAGLFGGRASGGHVRGGGMYRVTDGEGFMPAGSGTIIPLGRMRSAGGGGVTLRQTVNVDARGVNPEGFAEHIRQSVRQETVQIVSEGMGRVRAGVPARMAEYERDGR